jgi:hypothetical protein
MTSENENHNHGTKPHTKMEEDYLSSLTPKEKMAYEIAKSHLGTLFTLSKTSGYLQWKKAQDNPN